MTLTKKQINKWKSKLAGLPAWIPELDQKQFFKTKRPKANTEFLNEYDLHHIYLKNLFLRNGIKQREAAEALGMYQSDLSRVVHGLKKFPKKHVSKFCRLFKIKQKDFMKHVRITQN